MDFRELSKNDFQSLYDLVRGVYRQDPMSLWLEEEPDIGTFDAIFDLKIKGMASGRVIDIVACEDDEIVGECELAMDGQRGALGIIVKSSYRAKGIGKRLLALTIEDAKRLGIKGIDAEVIESNKRALDFLSKAGFVLKGVSGKELRKGKSLYRPLLLHKELR